MNVHNAVMDWTAERDNELRQFVKEGKTSSKIADYYCSMGMPCTRNMVIGRIGRIGLSKKRGEGVVSVRSVINRKRKERREGERRAVRGRRLKPMRWQIPDIGAPPPLNIPAGDLENYHCKAVMDGTGDRCEPLYCGLHAPDRRYCDYHTAKFIRRVRL